MTLAAGLTNRLASDLVERMRDARPAYCLRVDDLGRDDALAVCARMIELTSGDGMLARVLDHEPAQDERLIDDEHAIEIRNRKVNKLCLFVPSGYVDSTIGSTKNSFFHYDLAAGFAKAAREAIEALPDEVRFVVRRVAQVLYGATKIPPEKWADYVVALTEDPSLDRAGMELWRVGLLPDSDGEGFSDRLSKNRLSMMKLAYPARPQSTLAERIESLGLRPGPVKDELQAFLAGKRLRVIDGWLPELAGKPWSDRITFDRWESDASGGNLDAIELESILDANGKVRAYTKLQQPLGAGTQPVANIGNKGKVTVKWSTQPAKVEVDRWSLEVIPAVGEYTEDEVLGVELPSCTVPASRRQASIPMYMEVDFEELTVRAVQVRITALDASGSALANADGHVVEDLTGEFWLSPEPPSSPVRLKRDTAPNLAYARLAAAVTLKDDVLEEASGQWEERDLHYFPVMFNGQLVSKVGLSGVLRALEELILRDPEGTGAFRASVDAADLLDVAQMTPITDADLADRELWRAFVDKRRAVFQAIRGSAPRDLIETIAWTSDLSAKVRRYAATFRALVEAGSDELRREALLVDTIRLTVERPGGADEALIVSPTHPLRLLWYASYAELLGAWERQILALEKDRTRSLDMTLLARVAPLNVPGLLPGDGSLPFLFAQNLRFFWGVALPADAQDPGRIVADIARVLGLPEDEATLIDLPPARLAAEIKAYCDVHPYLNTLRLNAVNPGSGGFLADALSRLYTPPAAADEDDGARQQPPRLDLIAHTRSDVAGLPALTELQAAAYATMPRGGRRYLAPFFSNTVRPLGDMDRLPGGDVNMAIVSDYLAPSVEGLSEETNGDSSSFYGLLVRMIPEFESAEGGCRWRYRFAFPTTATRERHPVASWLGNELIDLQRVCLEVVAKSVSPGCSGCAAAVSAAISPDERVILDRLHAQADWVVTLDRFFGPEFFDDPVDTNIGSVARKYLLDYAPEFLEGLGHRMLVTTAHRGEIEEILARAMGELGFGLVEESTGEVLDYLKTISGRLALRVVGNDSHAREAVSLGVVAAYLKSRGELDDAILVPVDAHPELFGPTRPSTDDEANTRCDLVRVRLQRGRLLATFIEVKSRSAGVGTSLLDRIADQVTSTENVFRELFFRADPPRIDHVLQRSRLFTLLHFYLRRAWRHRLIRSEEQYCKLEEGLAKLESGIPAFSAERWGFVVNLNADPEPPVQHRGVTIKLITETEVMRSGLSISALRSTTAPPAAEHESPIVQAETEEGEAGGEEASVSESESPQEPEGVGPTPEGEPPGGGPGETAAPDDETEESTAESTVCSEVEHVDEPTIPAEESEEQPPSGEPVEQQEATQRLLVELGATVLEQNPVLWEPSIKGSPHMFVLGIPGQGKSCTVTHVLCSLAEQGLPALVMDFHGQFSDPDGPFFQEAQPHVMNAARGLPFSPFEADATSGVGAGSWKANCFAVAEIFEYVCGLGEMQRDVVFLALKSCYEDLGYVEGNQSRFPTVSEFAEKLTEVEGQSGVRNVVARCRPLLELDLFSDSTDGESPLSTLFERGVVLDVHELGVETLQLAAGAFLLRKLYKDMVRWGETDRLRLAIVLDEAHRLAKDVTLPKLMKEGRKFGLLIIVASQGLADYHADVVGNAGTKVVFRTNYPQSKKVAGFLKSGKKVDLTDEVEQLGVGEAFVQTPEMAKAERTRMIPRE